MNRILYPKSTQKIKVVAIILIVILLLLITFFSLGFINKNSNKILKGVHINALDVGSLTIEEAKDKLNKQQNSINSKKYVLLYKNREVVVSGDEIDLQFQNDLIDKAYAYGKGVNFVENSVIGWKSLFGSEYTVDAKFSYDEEILTEKINVLLEDTKATVANDSYEVSGDKILVFKGYDGVNVKNDEIKQLVLDNAGTADAIVRLTIPTSVEVAKRIDFEEIYNEVYVEKKNAAYEQKDDGDKEYVEEVIGKTFDKNAAIEEYTKMEAGTTIEIPIVDETPEITTANLDNVLFKDVLATFKTKYDANNKDRSTNLEVAARNINETIILPGEIFSYNKEVGQRTYTNGFKDAHIFSGGKVVDGLGGGICQVSSTLYNAVLMADLEVVERKNHMMHTQYVEPSLDATVVWGSIDFRFKNNRETPIKIVATVKNGIATTTIYGMKSEKDPIIEIQSVIEKTIPYTTVTEYDNTLEEGKTIVTQDPVNGYVSKAYRIEKDANGKELSKTLISSDTYKQTSKIVTVGTKKVEKPVEPVVPETPTVTPENNNQNNDLNDEWPIGWDTPENPYYQGN